MTHQLAPLPYSKNALEPFLSRETLEFHYEKHHRGYLEKLNELVLGTEFANSSLESIVQEASGKIYLNSAQVWNHNFYWNCMSGDRVKIVDPDFKAAIQETFGSVEKFEKEFQEKGMEHFGSGYLWLISDLSGKLQWEAKPNAENPIKEKRLPLLTCDLWEHAYYIDHRNERAHYLEGFWKNVNWEFAEANFTQSFEQTRSQAV